MAQGIVGGALDPKHKRKKVKVSKASSKNRGKNKKKQARAKLHKENLHARRISNENIKNIEKPRKPIAQSFIAKNDSSDECPVCFIAIQKGDRVRYNVDNLLAHVSHAKKEIVYDICQKCFLAKPCECEENN